jgi:hypothetical protein
MSSLRSLTVSDLTQQETADLNNLPVGNGPIGGSSNRRGPQENRMIGDFDSSADPLWTLYGREAKSHDQSRIQTLKDNLDGVVIFVGFIHPCKFRLADALYHRPVYFLLLSQHS